MTTVTEVIENALALPLVDRSYIASKLIESLEREELSSEAIQEYDQRIARRKFGETQSSTSEELDDKAAKILDR